MKKNRRKGIFALFILFFSWSFFLFPSERTFESNNAAEKTAWVLDNGFLGKYSFSGEKTIRQFLEENKFSLRSGDILSIFGERRIFGGETIEIFRSKRVIFSVGGEEKKELETTRRTAKEAFVEKGILLGQNDFILPDANTVLSDGLSLSIVRVEIKEETERESIDFETKVAEDSDLGWREKKVIIKGEKGTREKKYQVITHDKEVVKKTLVSNEIIQEPKTEEIVQGTYVKVGKKHTGQGTWYAHTGTLAAASPWLPLGSYARVTNTANGKSVVVKINDRGPFGENRIIDLDKVAFSEIASIGAGVINVWVEEVLN